MSQSDNAALNLAYKANTVHQHAAMLISIIRSGETLTEREEEIIRSDLRELRRASSRVTDR